MVVGLIHEHVPLTEHHVTEEPHEDGEGYNEPVDPGRTTQNGDDCEDKQGPKERLGRAGIHI